MRRLLAAGALAVGATALAVLPAGAGPASSGVGGTGRAAFLAGIIAPPTLSGAVTCNTDGSATITWTLRATENNTQIDNNNVEVSGAVSGSATFTPNSLGNGEVATATTAVPAGIGGQVTIAVPWNIVKGPNGTENANVTVAVCPGAESAAAAVDAAPRTVG